jgi:hypothetical protein
VYRCSFKLIVINPDYKPTEKRGVEQTTDMKSSRKVVSDLLHEMKISEFNVRTSHSVAAP